MAEGYSGSKSFSRMDHGSKSRCMRIVTMETSPYLTEAEWASLADVGTGVCHTPIPPEHARRLLDLKLIYNLLGSCRSEEHTSELQ